MKELAKRFEQNEERYFFGAYYNAQAGNKDKAFEYLEKSYQRREMWMAYFKLSRVSTPCVTTRDSTNWSGASICGEE